MPYHRAKKYIPKEESEIFGPLFVGKNDNSKTEVFRDGAINPRESRSYTSGGGP